MFKQNIQKIQSNCGSAKFGELNQLLGLKLPELNFTQLEGINAESGIAPSQNTSEQAAINWWAMIAVYKCLDSLYLTLYAITYSLRLQMDVEQRVSLLDGINKSLQAQKLVTKLDSYNHTHVGGQKITSLERYGVMTKCMDLFVCNINNDTNITTAFPTIKAAPTALIGMKLQYTSQELGCTIKFDFEMVLDFEIVFGFEFAFGFDV
ncbi:MAG: hypothetical protein EZS28_019393 [Streblomastix strix]|uniref:Uncharacterized protein n=1 Tax=Streblomastix strix TaxID=222440 RepID=A0A5J4VRR8_9EUKA|nr:MAG: hypothetical protein EZS28_019393 [Streblomastix strix]